MRLLSKYRIGMMILKPLRIIALDLWNVNGTIDESQRDFEKYLCGIFVTDGKKDPRLCSWGSLGSLVAVFGNVREISVELGAVQTVADDEVIGDGEEGQIRLKIHQAAVGLIQ